MNKSSKRLTTLLALGLSLLLVGPVFAQDYDPSEERSDFDQRKISIMDGNRMRATYHNTGHAGRRSNTALNELLFEFPRNTNREYMYFMSVMFGTEVPQQNENNIVRDSFPMVNVSSYRTNRTGTLNWSLNPIQGYARDDADEMARSDRGPNSTLGNTWPDSWPDKFEDGGDGWASSWNGFFGRDQFNADVEFYYKAGDDLYTRFLRGSDEDDNVFQPDPTDENRGGMGIIMDTRILAWSQTLVNATHFNIFEIKNDGGYDYPRMAFGLWIADFVAGGGPTDEPLFDNIRAIAYLTDTDRQSGGEVFGGTLIGEMGLKFIETPGNAIDGIDNDGDSDSYDPISPYRIADNVDLYSSLLTSGGGFYNRDQLVDTLIREFVATDFDERVINIGDKIVRILDDNSRVIDTYTGAAFTSQGVEWNFGGTIRVTEDNLPQEDADFGIHIDGLDSDFDGLIDENAPNHLTKNTFDPGSGTFIPRPVRFINYLAFEVGDTLSRGLIVPNQTIRQRIATDSDFATLVNDQFGGRLQNYFTSAPMMDEGRDDFFDNDNDWNSLIDDVGIEGDEGVVSEGQGDGVPSSGAGTSFPGEPSIDKTDVSETDLIGVSKVRIFDAGALQVNQDGDIWTNYLIPGEFLETPGTDSDIYVSSGLFPLSVGSSERFAVAITAAQENRSAADDRNKVNARLDDATTAYEADYQFAVAPTPPILTAVAGDGKVTLYWDTSSEESLDRYIKLQTGDGKDFEGYKVYRTTDVSFEEILTITDGFGSGTFLSPRAVYDLRNGINGFHPVADNGLQFNLGGDTGLQRVFVDNDVINGRKYYYAVTAYDRGFAEGGISPSESPVQISLNPDGTVVFGQNVVEVRPSAEAAGYISPDEPLAQVAEGSPGGSVTVEIIDPRELLPDNVYDVVFEDTVKVNPTGPDTLTTKNFTLRNVTSGTPDTLISRSTQFNGGNNPVLEGFTIRLDNIEETGIDEDRTEWSFSTETSPHNHEIFTLGPPKISDYDIIIGDNVGFGQSVEKLVETSPGTFTNLASVATNFRVFNTYLNEEVDYAFLDLQNPTTGQQRCNPTFFPPDNYTLPDPGQLSAVSSLSGRCSDLIYFVEDFREFEDTVTYRVTMSAFLSEGSLLTRNPEPGDTLKIFTNKPFISGDRFQFTFDEENVPRIDADTARSELDDILVIPNPYKVANIYEASVTATNRQHNRELHFTNLPAPSTLRIFTVAGVLIREIDIQPSDLVNGYGGTYIWDMLTKDNLEISYGIYLYQVDAPGVGEKVGKFAVIK
jgi:hypothetical protein